MVLLPVPTEKDSVNDFSSPLRRREKTLGLSPRSHRTANGENSNALKSFPVNQSPDYRPYAPYLAPIAFEQLNGQETSYTPQDSNIGEPNHTDEKTRTDIQFLISELQAQRQASENTIRVMQNEMQQLRHHLLQITAQAKAGQNATKDYPTGVLNQLNSAQLRQHHREPTTYEVPKRSRSRKIDRLTSAVPFYILMVIFGIGLAASIALASFPSLNLWMATVPFIVTLLRGLFVTVVFGSIITFVLENFHHESA